MIRKIFTSCFVVLFGASFGLAAGPVPMLGQVVAKSVVMDGISVPSGTTVLNKTELKTSQNPAFVHLSSGQVVQLHRNSSAYLETTKAGEVQVAVRTGTMSYRVSSGAVETAVPETTVLFPTDALPAASPQRAGLRVVLTERAESGQSTIAVNDARRIDPQQAILLRSRDGLTQEVHYVQAFQGNNVRLTAPLQNSFDANSPITQDPDVVKQAVAAGAVVAGAAAGASAGAAAVGAVAAAGAAAGAGLGTAAIVVITAAAVGGTLGTLAATDTGFFSDEDERSP